MIPRRSLGLLAGLVAPALALSLSDGGCAGACAGDAAPAADGRPAAGSGSRARDSASPSRRPSGAPRNRGILTLGWPAGVSANGSEHPSEPPAWSWTSPRVDLQWPARVELSIPPGMGVTVVLDLDQDGRPSAGDAATRLLRGYRPPSGGSTEELELDRSWQPGPTGG